MCVCVCEYYDLFHFVRNIYFEIINFFFQKNRSKVQTKSIHKLGKKKK